MLGIEGKSVLTQVTFTSFLALTSVLGVMMGHRGCRQLSSAHAIVLANRLGDEILAAGSQPRWMHPSAPVSRGSASGDGDGGSEAGGGAFEEPEIGAIGWSRVLELGDRLVELSPADADLRAACEESTAAWRALSPASLDLATHPGSPDPAAVERWLAASSVFVQAEARVLASAVETVPQPSHEVAFAAAVKRSCWLASAYAGLERETMSLYLESKRPVPERVMQHLWTYRGIVARNVDELRYLARTARAPLELRQSVVVMNAASSRFVSTRDAVYRALDTGSYPVTAEQWNNDATAVVDGLLQVGIAGRLIGDLEAERVASRGTIVFAEHSGFSLLAAALFVVGFTKVRRTARDLVDAKEQAEVSLRTIGDGVVTTDESGRIRYVNRVAEELIGLPAARCHGRPVTELLRFVDAETGDPEPDPVRICLTENRVVGIGPTSVVERTDGTRIQVEQSVAPVRSENGLLTGTVMVIYETGADAVRPHLLSYHVTHDALTDLLNRREFERVLAELRQGSSVGPHALCLLDLDQFKVVNDTCGFHAGDELLRQLARQLKELVRESDEVARLGGDEFGLLLRGCPPAAARTMANRVLGGVRELGFRWEGRLVEITASIGVVPLDGHAWRTADVLEAADAACFAAKDKGRNRVQLYHPSDAELVHRQGEMQWVTRLTEALREQRLLLYAQAVVPLRGSARPHYEVLLRLLGEDGEVIPAGQFVGAAEKYSLMPQIDRWVVDTAMGWLRSNGVNGCPPRLALNLSGLSFADDSLLELVCARLGEGGINPESLCFEITETAAVSNIDVVERFIASLREQGVRFALDDFGTGLSSLAYLRRLGVDYLKIDRSFVRNVARDGADRSMVEAIHHMGRRLGIATVAEGVEGSGVLDVVREIGVDYAQGWATGRPFPLTDLGVAVSAI